eukprot:4547867-Pyramimonas_sp.AAC.1
MGPLLQRLTHRTATPSPIPRSGSTRRSGATHPNGTFSFTKLRSWLTILTLQQGGHIAQVVLLSALSRGLGVNDHGIRNARLLELEEASRPSGHRDSRVLKARRPTD